MAGPARNLESSGERTSSTRSSDPSTPVCIAGMHRSGTSMVAGLLHRCGLTLGDEEALSRPAPDNPAGFWEDAGFVQLNDELLAAWGGGWDWPRPMPAGWEKSEVAAQLRVRADALVAGFGGRGPWGWKDPRNSLTLEFWRAVLPGLPVVVCLRNPLEVAASLHIRNYLSLTFGIGLWKIYYETILRTTGAEQRVITHYEAFFADPEGQVRRLLGSLSLTPGDDQIAGALPAASPALRHSRFETRDLLGFRIPSEVIDLYARLCEEAGWMDPIRGRTDSHGFRDGSEVPRQATSWEETAFDSAALGTAILKAELRQRDEALRELQEVVRSQQDSIAERDRLIGGLHERVSERDERIGSLTAQLEAAAARFDEAPVRAQSRILDLEDAVRSSRQEAILWKSLHDESRMALEASRNELARWQTSRLWRLGTVYWSALRIARAMMRAIVARFTPRTPAASSRRSRTRIE